MPSKKKRYNARFPAGRIKKIMQMDDDVGKIAHAVPVIISRSVELFVNSLLQQTADITRERNAKTLSLTHTKLCILKEQKFDFLKDLVKDIEDVSPEEERKSSKNNPTMPTVSHIEVIEEINHCDSRKRIKSESYEDSLSNQTEVRRQTTKRRFYKTKNAVDIDPLAQDASSSSSFDFSNDINNCDNHSENIQNKSESFSSCDLVIDEDYDI